MTMGLFLLIAISVASLISISDAAPAESRINEAGNLAGHTVLKASILARRKRSIYPSNNGLFGIPKPGGAGPDDARALLLTHTKERVGTSAGAGEAGWKPPTSGGQIQASSNIGTGTIIGGGIKPAIGVDNLPRPVSAVGLGIDPGFSGGGRGGGFKPDIWGGVDTGFSGGAEGGRWPLFEGGIRPGYDVGAGIGGAWPSFADGIRVGFILGAGLGGRWPSFGGGVGSGDNWGGGAGGTKPPVGVAYNGPPVGVAYNGPGYYWGEGEWIGSPVSVVGGSGGGGGGEGGGGDAGWRVGGSAGYVAAPGWGAASIGNRIGGGDGGGGGGGKVHIGGNQLPGGGTAPKPEAAALIGHGGVAIAAGGGIIGG